MAVPATTQGQKGEKSEKREEQEHHREDRREEKQAGNRLQVNATWDWVSLIVLLHPQRTGGLKGSV